MTEVQPLRIPRPDPNKEPLKNNAFTVARSANTALCPLFPYLGDGDMVPAVTVFTSGPDTGTFLHLNTVDEVVVLYGTKGAHGHAGDVFTGGREHVVTGRVFTETADPDAVMSLVVTQRQAESGVPQSESLSFLCENCQNPLLVDRFEAKGVAPRDAKPGYQAVFETVVQSANSAETYNREEATRTCTKCGHVNPTFPVRLWGWQNYRDALAVAEHSRDCYFGELVNLGETV